MNNGNTKKPFQFGLRRLTAADLKVSVKPVTNPIAEPETEPKPVIEDTPAPIPEPEIKETEPEVVVEEPKAAVEEPVITEITETLLEDAGFSARTVKKLHANDITTVEALQAYMETGAALEDLADIGTKFAEVIKEELNAWITGTADQSSPEKKTQDS